VLGGDISVGRVTLSSAPERATPHEVRYDFSCGELRASFAFDGDDARVEMSLTGFCSRTRPSLVLQEAVITVDRDCDLSLSAITDTRDIPGSWVNREVHPSAVLAPPIDGMLAQSRGSQHLRDRVPDRVIAQRDGHAGVQSKPDRPADDDLPVQGPSRDALSAAAHRQRGAPGITQ
jgi:hypothetical protein